MLFWVGELPGNKINTHESFVLYDHMTGCLQIRQNCFFCQSACRNKKEAMLLSELQKAEGFWNWWRAMRLRLSLVEEVLARDPRKRGQEEPGEGLASGLCIWAYPGAHVGFPSCSVLPSWYCSGKSGPYWVLGC